MPVQPPVGEIDQRVPVAPPGVRVEVRVRREADDVDVVRRAREIADEEAVPSVLKVAHVVDGEAAEATVELTPECDDA
jgi:hypothetical protein